MTNSIVSEIRERHTRLDPPQSHPEWLPICEANSCGGADWPCRYIKAADLIEEMAGLLRERPWKTIHHRGLHPHGEGNPDKPFDGCKSCGWAYHIEEFLREHGMEGE